ncbi:carboxypeptidase-like regulatory domain-containing protein [candidate division WOR-3 bacterium]|nr:carboxypeptidase-like regulatory domain-containing protein [candidate division WOR-3 bacterium]
MLKKWIIAVIGLVVLIPVIILAEDFGKIEGTVTDKKNNKPLPMVNVIVKGTSLGSASGVDGNFVITNITPGDYSIMATMMGYKAVTKSVKVLPGETTLLDFELKESTIELGGIVVTGTRTPRYIKEIPVRTEVITARTLG